MTVSMSGKGLEQQVFEHKGKINTDFLMGENTRERAKECKHCLWQRRKTKINYKLKKKSSQLCQIPLSEVQLMLCGRNEEKTAVILCASYTEYIAYHSS